MIVVLILHVLTLGALVTAWVMLWRAQHALQRVQADLLELRCFLQRQLVIDLNKE